MNRRRGSIISLYIMSFALATAHCGPREPPTPLSIGRACIFAMNCAGDNLESIGPCTGAIEQSFASHQPNATPPLEVVIGVCGTATSCSSYQACRAHNHNADYCTAHPGGSCDGSLAIDCPGSTPFVTDCSLVQAPCNVGNGRAGCVTNRPCDPGTETAHCSGTHRIACDSATHLESDIDCGANASGWNCDANAPMGADCVPGGPACSGTAERCEGTVLVACIRGHEERTDCASIGGRTCVPVSSGFTTAMCAATGPECADSTLDTCSGTTLQTCIDGRVQSYDCIALGFRTCRVGTYGPALCSN